MSVTFNTPSAEVCDKAARALQEKRVKQIPTVTYRVESSNDPEREYQVTIQKGRGRRIITCVRVDTLEACPANKNGTVCHHALGAYRQAMMDHPTTIGAGRAV
jgi:hypothetical protein